MKHINSVLVFSFILCLEKCLKLVLVFMFYFMVGKTYFLSRECNYLGLDAMQLLQLEYLNNVLINGVIQLWLDLILVVLFCFFSRLLICFFLSKSSVL